MTRLEQAPEATDAPTKADAVGSQVDLVLGPLPEAAHRGPTGTGSYFDAYTAAQMRAYAAEQVAAARERIAEWLATQRNDTPAQGLEFAAALRACGPNVLVTGTQQHEQN